MLKKHLLLLVLSFGLSLTPLLAQQKQWGIQECVDYALSNNLQLKLSELSVANSENVYETSQLSRLPNLNANASHSYNFGRSFDPFTNLPINQRIRSNSFSASSSTTLFAGNSITNTIKQNGVNLEVAKYDLEKAKNDMILNLLTAYLQIILNRELLSNARLQLQNTQAQLDRTNTLIDAGVMAEAARFDLQAQKAGDQQQIVNLENSVTMALLTLKQMLQLSPDQEFDIIVPTIPDPDSSQINRSTALIYASAESLQPQIKSADLAKKSADLGLKIAQANRMPTLSFNLSAFTGYTGSQKYYFIADGTTTTVPVEVGYVLLDPTIKVYKNQEIPNGEVVDFTFGRQLKESFRQSIGLSLSIPIFNRGQVRSSEQSAKIQIRRADLNAQLSRNQLQQTIEQAQADVRASYASYVSTKDRLTSLEEAFRSAQNRFQAGAATTTDLNLALNNLNSSKTEVIRWKYDLFFKMKILDFYEGKTISF